MVLLLLLPALFIHKERDLALRQLLVLLLLRLGELAIVQRVSLFVLGERRVSVEVWDGELCVSVGLRSLGRSWGCHLEPYAWRVAIVLLAELGRHERGGLRGSVFRAPVSLPIRRMQQLPLPCRIIHGCFLAILGSSLSDVGYRDGPVTVDFLAKSASLASLSCVCGSLALADRGASVV